MQSERPIQTSIIQEGYNDDEEDEEEATQSNPGANQDERYGYNSEHSYGSQPESKNSIFGNYSYPKKLAKSQQETIKDLERLS